MPLTLENTPLPVLLLGLFAPVSLFVLIPGEHYFYRYATSELHV